jgi:hypothetical protein
MWQEAVNRQATTYLLDLSAGLTQVPSDALLDYLFGIDLIALANGSNIDYFLGDALGSVLQITDASGVLTLAKNYDPFGNVVSSLGTTSTSNGFTAEQTDPTGLIYLRARY